MKQEFQHKTIISELSLKTETTDPNILNTFSNKTPLNTNSNSIINYESTRNVSISGIITPTCKLTKGQNNPINTIYYYPKKIVLKKRAQFNYKQTNNISSNKKSNINEHKHDKQINENHNNNSNMSNPINKKQTILSKIILLKHNEKKDKKEIINKDSFIYQRKKSLDKCISSHKQKANRTFNDEPKTNKHTHSLNTISYNENNKIKNKISKEYNAPSLKKHAFDNKMQIQTNEMFSIESKDNNNSITKLNQNYNTTYFTNVCKTRKNNELDKTHFRTKTPSSMATTPKDVVKTFDQYSNNKNNNNNISLNSSSTQTPRYNVHKLPKNVEYLHEIDNSSSLSSCVLTPKHSERTSTNETNSNNYVSNATSKANNRSLYSSLHSSNSIITTCNTYYHGHKTHSSLLRLSVPTNNNYNVTNINNECKKSSVMMPTRNNNQYTSSNVINDNNNNDTINKNVNISNNSDFIKTLRNKLASNSFRNKHEQLTSLYENNKNNLNTKYKQHICNTKHRSISNQTNYNYKSNEIINSFREAIHNNISSYNPNNYYLENDNGISSVKKQYCLHSNNHNVNEYKGNTNYFNESKPKPLIHTNNNNGNTNSYTQYMANQNKIDRRHRDYKSFIINQSNRVKLDSYIDSESDIQHKRKFTNKYSLSFINNYHNRYSTLTGTSLIYDYDKIGKELYSK